MNAIQRIGAALLGLEVKLKGGSAVPYVGSSQSGRAVATEWTAENAVKKGLKASAWVYSACGKISTGLASVPLVLEQLVKDQWQAVPEHPIQMLLDRPNPHMARQDVMERWALHMLLAGNALWFKNLVQGKPMELWPLMPDQIKPLPSRTDFLTGYEWRPTSQDRLNLSAEQVAHWMFVDPSNIYWGMSPLQAAARAVDTDNAAADWNRAVLANDGKPPFAVLLEKSMTADQQAQANAQLHEQVNGTKARRFLLLGGTTKVQSLSMNATELDYLNSRKFQREEIAAAFGVPPVLLSFGEAATFANLDAAKAMLWEDRIVPLLDDLCQGLMMSLFPHWGFQQGDWRIRPDLSGVRALQGNLKTEAEVGSIKASTLKAMVEAGVPVNMAARYLDMELPEIEGGDAPRAPAPAAAPAVKLVRPRFERKDKAVDSYLGRLDDWTAELKDKVAEILLEQGSTLASAYAAGDLDKALDLSLDDWQTLLEAAHTALLESEGAVAYTALASALTVGGTFDTLDASVVGWISEHVGEAVKGIADTTRTALVGVVKAGVEEGAGTREIAKRIGAQFEDWSKARAELIARTEVSTAFGAAHQLTAQQIEAEGDLKIEKTWRSAHDSRVRPAHKAMDGETVPLDEAFSNGLMHPGEPNCRCVVTYAEAGS